LRLPTGRWERTAIGVWAIILVVTGVRPLVTPQDHTVYPIFVEAARRWLDSAPLYQTTNDPYRPSPLFGTPFDRPASTMAAHCAYRYSPLVTVLFIPSSLLPDGVGGLLWRVLNAAIFLAAAQWWLRLLPFSLSSRQRAIFFLMMAPLAAGNLHNGQSNLLVVGLLISGIAAMRRDRWNLAAACVVLACLFKLYPLAVGLLLSACYPRRFGPRFLAALFLGLALPFLLQNPAYVGHQYTDWFTHLQENDRQVLARDQWYRDLRLLYTVWVAPMSAQRYLFIQLVAAGGIGVVCLLARGAGWSRPRVGRLIVSLGCCWMTTFGPATESATYIMLAPVVASAVLEAWSLRKPSWAQVPILGSYCLLLTAQIVNWFPFGKAVQGMGVQPLGGLLLLTGLLATTVPELLPGRNLLKTAEPQPLQAS
jgi:hypothetical protein